MFKSILFLVTTAVNLHSAQKTESIELKALPKTQVTAAPATKTAQKKLIPGKKIILFPRHPQQISDKCGLRIQIIAILLSTGFAAWCIADGLLSHDSTTPRCLQPEKTTFNNSCFSMTINTCNNCTASQTSDIQCALNQTATLDIINQIQQRCGNTTNVCITTQECTDSCKNDAVAQFRESLQQQQCNRNSKTQAFLGRNKFHRLFQPRRK